MSTADGPEPIATYCSTADGDRYVIVDDREFDMTGWRIEIRSSAPGREGVRIVELTRDLTWSGGPNYNGLGYGEPRRPWSAFCDHNEWIIRWIRPGEK